MSAYKYKERILDYIGKLLMLPDVYSQVRETFFPSILARHKDGDFMHLFEKEEGKDTIEVDQEDWKYMRLQAFYVLICLPVFNSSIGDQTDMLLKNDILDDEILMQDMPSLIKQIIFALLASQPKTEDLLVKLGPHLQDINSMSGLSEVKNLFQST
jgi:hypothetical protein